MNRFDSAFTSRQSSVGRWLRALVLTAATALAVFAGVDVKAQTVTLGMSPVAPNSNPVCAGSPTRLRASLNTAGINIGYAAQAVGAYPGQFAPGFGNGQNIVALDDDEVSAQILVPGAVFPFHGENIDLGVNGFYIGSNGFVTFRNDPLAVQIAPRNLGAPGAGQTYNAIYLCNTDLSPQVALGVDPVWWEYDPVTQTVVVTFEDVPYFYPNPPGPIPPGAPNPAEVDVQLVMYCVGSANPGRIQILIDNINDNNLNVQAAQEQYSVGMLNNCQPAVGTVGYNQAVGALNNVELIWDPGVPALAGTQTQFFRCPTPNVNCNGTGGSSVGVVVGAGPDYDQLVTPPASTVNQLWYYYARTTLNNCAIIQDPPAPNPSFLVTANAQPVTLGAITPATNAFCEGNSVTFTAVPSIAGSTLAWSTTAPGAGIILSGTQNESAQFTFPGGGSNGGSSYNIQIIETGPAPTNCAATTTYVNRVTIYTTPTGSLTPVPATVCVLSGGVANSVVTAPAGYGSYVWSITSTHAGTVGTLTLTGAGNARTLNIPAGWAVQPLGPQTVTVQCIMGNGPGPNFNLCNITTTVNITVNPIPPANNVTDSPDPVCVNQPVTYTIGGTVGVVGNTYSYVASGLPFTYTGPSLGYVNGTPLAANVLANQSRQLQWTSAGTGTMTVTEATASGCIRTYSQTTTVNPLPTPAIIGSNTPCQFIASIPGNPSYQTAPTPLDFPYATGSPAGNSFRWVVSAGGSIIAANAVTTTTLPSTSTAPGGVGNGGTYNPGVTLVTIRWTGTGAQTVSLMEQTAIGNCQAFVTLNVTVQPTPINTDFGVTGTGITGGNVCAAPGPGNVVPYNTVTGAGSHTISVTGGTITASAGGWTISGGGSQVSGVGVQAAAFTVTWGAAGTGTISDEYTAAGCAAVETYTITINPNPTFSITGPALPLCGNQNHTFSVSALVNGGGAPIYTWSEAADPDNVGNAFVNSGLPNQTVTFVNPPGASSNYTIQCIVQNNVTGCQTTVTQLFVITQVPTAPTVGAVVNSCAASPQNPVSTQNYLITAAAGTLNISLVGAPAGSSVSSPVAHGGGGVNRLVTWGQLGQNPLLAPQNTVVTINATITVAGCISPVGTTNTTLWARPAPAPVDFGTPLPWCVNTPVPINVAVDVLNAAGYTPNGQPGVNYTWAVGGGLVLNAAGAAPDLTRQITALGGAGAKSITVTGTHPASGCQTTTTTNLVVDPVPTPSITLNVPAVGINANAACQSLTNPIGQPHAAAWPFVYTYSTPHVAGNTYSWQITNGYIVSYSTDNGGTFTPVAGNVAAITSEMLPATLNASRIRVVFFGASPAKVKVTEVHPGGCGATTPDYNVNLNVYPTAHAFTTTPQLICNTGTQTAPVSLAGSQVGYQYSVQRSADGGATWAAATTLPATINGTGAAINFTIQTASLGYAGPAPVATTYLFRVVANSIAPTVPAGCGPYEVSTANVQVDVHAQPAFNLAVTISPNVVCAITNAVNVNIANTETWVTYALERAQIADNSTGAAIAPVWAPTGISGVGTGGNLLLVDNTSPTGGYPLLATPNYQYRVVATSNVNPPACQVTLTAQPTATIFAQPQVFAASYNPNPVCWEANVAFQYAGTQDGVTYEVLRNGASMVPPITFNGTGAATAIINIPALQVLAANPAVPTNVTFTVRARLRTGVAPYNRPVPASQCPQDDAGTVVVVNPKPVAAFTGTNPACGPSVGTYTATTPSFGGWPATYDWKILGVVDNTVEIPVTTNPPTGTTPLVGNNTGFGTMNPFVTNWGVHPLSCNGTYNPLPVKVRMIETNSFGCPDTAVVTVTVNPTIADASIAGPTTACIYGGFEEHLTTYTVSRAPGCVFPAGTTFLWSMPTGPVVGVIRSGQNTPTIVAEWTATGGTNIGTISLTMTLPPSHGGCATTITYNVTVYPQPQPVISGPTQVCQNSTGSPTSTSIYSATLFTGDTYKWDVVGGTITTPAGTGAGTVLSPSTTGNVVNLNSITVTWGTSPNPNATVTLTQTSVVGCINRTVMNVVVHPTPNPAINGPGVVCNNSTNTYSTANNAPANSYAWSISAGTATITSGANQATATILSGAVAGSFTIQLIETTNATTCSKTVTRVINVVEKPNPTITRVTAGGGIGGACVNQTITYGQTETATPSPSFSQLWTVVNGTIVGPNNGVTVNVMWDVPGTGTVTLTKWQTSSQCTTVVSQNVNVVTPPAPAITGPTNVCGLSTQTYSTPNVAGNTYAWSLSNGTVQSGAGTSAIQVLWNNPVAGATNNSTVSVTETNTLSGCATTVNISVTIRYQPQVVAITGPAQACAYNAVTNPANANYSVSANAGAMYTWTVTGGTIQSGQGTAAIAVRWTTIGNQTVTLVEKDGTGLCAATSTLNVSVTYMPAPVISGNNAACSNTSETYSTPNVAGSTYAWSIAPAGGFTILSGVNANSMTVQWTTAGARTITVTETAGACVATANFAVTVTAKPAPAISKAPLGLGLNQACMDDVATYSTAATGNTFVWTVTGGNITSGQGTNAIVINWTNVGNQTITVTETATANTACVGTASINVAVEERPNPVIAGPTPVCTGAATTYGVTAVPGHTYNWTVTGAAADRTITTSTVASTLGVTWNNAGSYTVAVTQTNGTGNCAASTSMTVVVNLTPNPVISKSPLGLGLNQACNDDVVTYSTPATGNIYLWTVTGGSITSGQGTNAIVVNWTNVGNQTVSVTETAAANAACFRTATINVAVEDRPNPVITGSTPVCTGATHSYSVTAVPAHTYSWTISGTAADRTIVSSTNANTMSVTWNNAGSYTVGVTQTNGTGNCVASTSITVVVNQTPNPVIGRLTAPTNLLGQACQGQTIDYTRSGTGSSGVVIGNTYMWTATGGVIVGSATNATVSVTWQTIGNNTLTVTETTGLTTCSRTATQNVAVSYTPTPSITGSTVVCINKEHAYSTPAVPGSTYNWVITPTNSFAVIAGYPNNNAIQVRWIQPGLHTMSVTETALGGFCFTTTTVNIRVNPIPTPDIQSATGYGNPITRRPGIVCNNSTHTYTVTPTPGNVFQWAVTGGTILSGQNTNTISVLWGAAGNGTVACTETVPGSDCITTDRDTILIRPTPTPVVTGQVNPCGASVQDYTTPFVTGNSYQWTVVGGTFVTLAPNTIRVTWSSPVWPNTTAASVSVREDVADVLPAGTCFGTNTLGVTIRPIPPVPSITGPTVVCATDLSDTPQTINTASYTSSNPGTTAGSGSLSLNWTVTNGTIVSGQNTFTVGVQWQNTGNAPITGTLAVTHTSSFGCSATGSLNVTINPLPNPIIAGPRSVCQNSLQNYSTPGIPGNTYSWSVSGGNIIRAGQGTPNVTVEWTLPGAATITVSEVNSFGCVVLNTANITVNALPTANLTASGPTTFCQGGDVTLSAPIGFSSYIWNTGETSRSIVVRTTGRYWVRVTDENGCSNNSDSIQVNVFPSTLPIITLNGPTAFCEGGSVTLTAPAGFSAYLWSTGATTQSIVVTETGSYTVSVADGNGCTGTSTEVDVTVYAKPTPVLQVIGSTNLCANDSVEVRAPAGFVSYSWTSSSGVNYGTSRTIVIKTTDTVYCTVVDINGCTGSSDTIGVVMAPVVSPVITANGPTTFCEGGAVTLTAPAGFASYLWSNGATGRTITVEDGGEYWVTVMNNLSCPGVSSKTQITVNDLPAVPTITRMGDVLSANSNVATAWQWFRNGTIIPGATAKEYTVALPGSYRVEIADGNTCASTSDAFEVILTDVEGDVVAGRVADMHVSPNPTSGRFSIETMITNAGPVRIELINAVGQQVMTLNEATAGGQFRTSVDMGTLASGVYNVIVTSGNERWMVRLVRQ